MHLSLMAKAKAKKERSTRDQARLSLLNFVSYLRPKYKMSWHHRLLAEKLDQVVSGRIKRLAIFMPPGHTKTEYASRMLPAYYFGRNPNGRIIACSHTDDFSTAINRDVQRIMCEVAYGHLFPKSQLNARAANTSVSGQYRRTADYFEIVDHKGCYKSAGVGGNITGRRFDLGILDDPLKSREQADSATCRQRIWDWYANDFYTRQWTGAAIVLMHTRWHRDDLAGRLLRKMADRSADQWEVLNLPAIRTELSTHPADCRKPGEALWPAFKDQQALEVERQQDPRAFAALYQQNPAEAGGTESAPEYFDRNIWCPPDKWPTEFDVRAIGVDPSKGAKDKQGDYSAIVFVGRKSGVFYVDANLERRGTHQIVRAAREMASKYHPDGIGFETDQFQELVADEMQVQASDFCLHYNVLKMPTGGVNKQVRIRRLNPYIVRRLLQFKGDSPGCRLLVDQLMDFPTAEHDDGPDALEQAFRVVYYLLGITSDAA